MNKPTYWFFWILEHWGPEFTNACDYHGTGWVQAFNKEAAAEMVALGVSKEHGYKEDNVFHQVVIVSENDFKKEHTNDGYL